VKPEMDRRGELKAALVRRPEPWLLLLLAVYVALALQYNATSPLLGLRPDEQWHLAYVEYLQKHGALPVVDVEEKGGLARPVRGEREGIQPPLYYSLVALVTPDANLDDIDQLYTVNPYYLGTAWGNKNPFVPRASQAYATLRAGRLISLAFGVLALLATYGLARAFASSIVALLATALTAFNPQFLYMSTSFSNALAVVALCSLAIWATARQLGRALLLRRAAVLGILIGLATLAKLSGFVLAGAVPIILLADHLRQRSRKPSTWRLIVYCAVLVAIACLIPMPWFVRNFRLYGTPFTTPGLYEEVGEPRSLITLTAQYEQLAFLWKSYWLDFSPGGIVYGPSWLYLSYGVLLLCSGCGLLLAWRTLTRQRPYLILALFWVFLITVAVLATMLQTDRRIGGGRLLFPAAGAMSVLVAVGFLRLWPRSWKIPAAALLAALAISSAVFAWACILKPAYTVPSIPLEAAVRLPNHEPIEFGDGIWLDGWELSRHDARLGETVVVTLYWHRSQPVSTDYSVFLQLWSPEADALAYKGLDSYPGLGLYPTSRLPTDEILVDNYPLPIVSLGMVEEPVNARLMVGLYDLASGVRLTASSGEDLIGDHVELGRITIHP
jgi:4-amino-4-deoxy-L-arabinose transferase-like glycosyltransferase